MSGDFLFVGIGSDHGDDCVGWLVADELIKLGTRSTIVRRAKSPIDLLDWLDGIRCLGICDACRGAGPVGRWRRWTWPNLNASFVRPSGTHEYGLIDTLTLGARLGLLPAEVMLWGIEIASDQPGDQLTAEIREAIQQVASDVTVAFLCHDTA